MAIQTARVRIEGVPLGLIQHNLTASMAPSTMKAELDRLLAGSAKSKREPATVERVRRLEWGLSLYRATRDGADYPTLPARVIRAALEGGARLTKDGARVRRGVQVAPDSVEFSYGARTGATIDELEGDDEFVLAVPVTVQRQRIIRVRALFSEWGATFTLRFNDDMANAPDLRGWLEAAGSFIGVGDWRIDSGGEYGGFNILEFDVA